MVATFHTCVLEPSMTKPMLVIQVVSLYSDDLITTTPYNSTRELLSHFCHLIIHHSGDEEPNFIFSLRGCETEKSCPSWYWWRLHHLATRRRKKRGRTQTRTRVLSSVIQRTFRHCRHKKEDTLSPPIPKRRRLLLFSVRDHRVRSTDKLQLTSSHILLLLKYIISSYDCGTWARAISLLYK